MLYSLVQTGNQSTIESRAPNHTISIQKDGKQTRYIVNGLTYHNLKEISDLAMYRKAKDLPKKMP